LREHEREFRQKGANLAAIGLGDMNYARIFREDTGITFPLLVDAGRIAYRAIELRKTTFFGLFTRENFAARARARAGGHRQHKLGKDPFQLGASFVFGPGNKDLFVHLSEYTGDNAPISSLLAAIP
jgi:AhpC/TSA antioxidant enzyme